MSAPKKFKVGLVVGAGGLKAAAAIGLFKVLLEHDIDIDIVVGCSGGSIVGALIASGLDPDAITEHMGRVWTNQSDIAYRAIPQIVGALAGGRLSAGLRAFTRSAHHP